MDNEFAKRVADYFTGSELLDVLDVPMDELVGLLEEYLSEQRTEIEEFMDYGIRN